MRSQSPTSLLRALATKVGHRRSGAAVAFVVIHAVLAGGCNGLLGIDELPPREDASQSSTGSLSTSGLGGSAGSSNSTTGGAAAGGKGGNGGTGMPPSDGQAGLEGNPNAMDASAGS